MEFKRKKPDCKFTVPDRPTVRQQLEYFSLAGGASDQDMLVRYWLGTVALIEAWECKLMPDYNVDIDELDNPEITNIMVWAGLQIRQHINSLDSLSKKS